MHSPTPMKLLLKLIASHDGGKPHSPHTEHVSVESYLVLVAFLSIASALASAHNGILPVACNSPRPDLQQLLRSQYIMATSIPLPDRMHKYT